MATGGIELDEKPIGEIVGRLIEEGKGYAQAEFGLARAKAEAKVDVFKLPALLLVGAFLFLQAAVIVLCISIAMALATVIGPLIGGLVATVVALAIAAILALTAKRMMANGK